jgi:tetratricopeptide (TPR) repeat protein
LTVVAGLALTAGVLAGESAIQRGDSLFQAKDMAGAIEAYQEAAHAAPENARAWAKLGLAQHYAGQYQQAIEAYRQADRLGASPTTTRYNLACANALLGNSEQAFQWLDKAIEAGFAQIQLVRKDTDLESLRNDSRWPDYVDRVERAARPCEYDERYNQFDFWVGEWDVYTPAGLKAGTNNLSKKMNGCFIFEEWQSVLGNQGRSMKYFDPVTETWNVLWVNDQGGIVHYRGTFRDGAMRLKGKYITAGGDIKSARATISPTADGGVRQFIEHSDDNGETWYIYFDGRYRPKDQALGQK